jgi:arylsulfatase A-like enzyme/Tfp pilus assembly protein PilF
MMIAKCKMRNAICILHFALCISCVRPPDRAARPNILLVTIDTFRADRLNATVAPNLDRLAARNVRFTNARSAVPLTLPSHTTILTGELPTVHGVRENGLTPLSDAHPTVARLLKEGGYDTAAFVGAFVLDRRFGLSQGFDTYDDRIPRDPRSTERLEAERPASAVVDVALRWLDAHHAGRAPHTPEAPEAPWFLWIHLYDPHAPYAPPREFVRPTGSQPPAAADLYNGEVAYADSQIARVFDWLASTHLDGATMVIVAGDHGEGLGDHGERTHGMLVYDSTLRVPLVISKPGVAAATVGQPVSLVDIAPTILAAAGVRAPSTMTGRDLVGLKPDTTSEVRARSDVRSVRLQADQDIYAETEYPRVAGWSPLQALTDGRWKAIRAGAATELYDVQQDPLEQHDVAATQTSTTTAFAARIDSIRATAKPSTPTAVSAEAQERLRALGYVASSAGMTKGEAAPNPSAHIAAWNVFEEALTALNAHDPRARAMLGALVASNADAPVFQTTYARSLLDAGRAADALAVYRAAAKRWPTDATLLHDLAVAAREAGRLDEARDADAAALTLAPDSATAHNGAGLVAIDQGRPQDAAREFGRATMLDPTNGEYWSNLGNVRRAVGDSSGAKQAYEQAIAIDSRNADAANGLGVLLVEAQRPAEAVAWFQRAIAAAPDMVEARLNLGIALQQSGDAAHAADAYRDVLKAPAKFARERDAATKLLASLGDTRNAR